jgi:peptidyl-prolyl cis-trans isomerase C
MRFRAILALSLALIAAPAWAQQAAKAAKPAGTASADPVVARVNGTELHRSDVIEAIRGLPPQVQQQPIERLYPALLDQMVGTMLVSQAGRKAKLQDDPEVKKRLALVQDQLIADAYVQRLLQKQVTDQKLHARYDKFVKDAPPREEVHARHILVANEDEAKAIIAELKKGGDFNKLAQEKTTDPSGKTSGGDLGYFTKEDMVPEFADAAFKLKPGEITDTPVKTQFGWHVIKVEDKRVKEAPKFEDVKPQIENFVVRKAQADLVTKLRADAKIERMDKPAKAEEKPAAAPAPAKK